MAKLRITKRVVDHMAVGAVVWDTDVKGFGVRRQGEHRVYMLKTRLNGRQRWFTIGEHGSPWTPESAREEAQRRWGLIRSGTNLAAVREARRTQPTVAEMCQRYLAEYARHHKKPASVAADQRNIDNHILPLLGSRTVLEITPEDIDDFKRKVRDGATRRPAAVAANGRHGRPVQGGPGAANRCLEALSKMFNLAEDKWGWRPRQSNPCYRIVHYPKRQNQRFLSSAEIDRLGATLAAVEADGSECAGALAALRLLLLTGARLREIIHLEWDWVDIERQIVNLPDSKTGQRPLFLNPAAVELLAGIPRVPDSRFVIAGDEPGQPLRDLQGPWRRIRKLAGIERVRIHDLRHTFASLAASSGASLPMIGKLLGHTQPRTTQRYAHLVHDPVKELNAKVGNRLGAALAKRPKDGAGKQP